MRKTGIKKVQFNKAHMQFVKTHVKFCKNALRNREIENNLNLFCVARTQCAHIAYMSEIESVHVLKQLKNKHIPLTFRAQYSVTAPLVG